MEATQLVNLTIEEVKKSISAGEKDSPMFKNIGECDEEIEITEAGRKLFARLGRKGGSRSSRKKTEASILNGRLGGYRAVSYQVLNLDTRKAYNVLSNNPTTAIKRAAEVEAGKHLHGSAIWEGEIASFAGKGRWKIISEQ